MHSMKIIVSIMHQVMRCQSHDRMYTIDIHGDQREAKTCYAATVKFKEIVAEKPVVSDQ